MTASIYETFSSGEFTVIHIYLHVILIGCLIDHDDRSKHWCSTKVDSSGNHIVGQNEFGYCSKNCPILNYDGISNQGMSCWGHSV